MGKCINIFIILYYPFRICINLCSAFFTLATARLDDDLAGYFDKQEAVAATDDAAAAANGTTQEAAPAQAGEEKKE